MPETLTQSAKLLVKLHGKGSRHIELDLETFTIGRKADNTLAIEDPAVSGHHARIVKVQFDMPRALPVKFDEECGWLWESLRHGVPSCARFL